MATPVTTSKQNTRHFAALGQGSPATAIVGAAGLGTCTVIDSIIVSNSSGGALELATVEIQKTSDSSVLWRGLAIKEGAAAPVVRGAWLAPGGVYKSAKDVSLKVVVTMVGATGINVTGMAHDETPEG